ncbi:hypothetical protein [Variovorax sp. YR216]|uniref:hypothetical protein n=1 Tax=Variovorax sp. YR216 TaxID=1882828 RepID=UPI00089513D3|nr:hypothetical protein [Variovorax sp. YR216]SEB25043.1 hypothetical protein SAMN05444680_12324 [Variovorax sp. YR216]
MRQRLNFIHELRANSNYPTFRLVVDLVYWFSILLAVVSFAGAVLALFWKGGNVASAIGAVLMGLLILLSGRVGKEAAMMLADLSDAAIHSAQKTWYGDVARAQEPRLR